MRFFDLVSYLHLDLNSTWTDAHIGPDSEKTFGKWWKNSSSFANFFSR